MRSSVLVTGAASGMGAAVAELLAVRGYHVALADIVPVESLVEKLERRGADCLAVHLDVSDEESWEQAVAQWAGAGRPVGLVNNAGINHRGGLQATTTAAWQRVLDVNLTGAFLGMRTAAPLLKGGGSIVNISSAAGLVGYHAAAYGASKWGLRGLTKTAAGEYAAWGIRVNSVHPGLVDTPLLAGGGAFVDSHLESIPAGRMGRPEEVAAVVAFLIGDESTYVSGAELSVDGGFVAMGAYGRILSEAARPSP